MTVQTISTVVFSWNCARLVSHRLPVLEDRVEHHAEHGDEDDDADPEDERVQVVHLARDRRHRRLQVPLPRRQRNAGRSDRRGQTRLQEPVAGPELIAHHAFLDCVLCVGRPTTAGAAGSPHAPSCRRRAIARSRDAEPGFVDKRRGVRRRHPIGPRGRTGLSCGTAPLDGRAAFRPRACAFSTPDCCKRRGILARIKVPEKGGASGTCDVASTGVSDLLQHAGGKRVRRMLCTSHATRCRPRAALPVARPGWRRSRRPRACAGSIRLATQPASARPRALIASADSSAWLRQPSRTPTTSSTGRPSRAGMSSMSLRAASGTSAPPAPSTTTMSATAASRAYAAAIVPRSIATPACAAARCGAIAGANEYGFTSASGAATLPAASSNATSAFIVSPRRDAGRDRLHSDRAKARRRPTRAAARSNDRSCRRRCRCR